MKVSLIMPALNESGSIASAFATIRAQTRLPDEVVIADGGSTDDTVAKARAEDGVAGIRVIVVDNPARFCGGGRNAAVRAASGDILVGMDFGNRADPDYIRRMVEVFANDPAAEYVGGPHFPIIETPFERAYAAIVDHWACIVPTIPPERLITMVGAEFMPGGMNLAFRRTLWERSGGFCEWAGSCDDVLFGLRVRAMGGKIVPTPYAIMHYHMGHTTRETWRRLFNYARWSGLTGVQSGIYRTTLLAYGGAIALLVLGCFQPWAFLALAMWITAYLLRAVGSKLWRIAHATGRSFTLWESLLSVHVRVVQDLATVLGFAKGKWQSWRDRAWRERTAAYIEAGRDLPPAAVAS